MEFLRWSPRALASFLAVFALTIFSMWDAPAQGQTMLTHLTAPAGIGEYEWALGVDRLLKKNSKSLRQRSQPTQGYIYNLRTMINSPAKWDTLVFNIDPIGPWLAKNKRPPFPDGLGKLQIRGLMNCTWPIWTLVTRDPNVNNMSDLKGRRIALGGKAGTATVMAEETLKAAGVYDKVKLQYLSFADITSGLLDGTIDVGLALLWYNAAANKIGPTQGMVSLEASKRGFHFVDWGADILRKTHDERGVPYKILTVPKGTMPLQTKTMVLYANPDYVAVSKDFPEDRAYEYIKQVIAHLDVVNLAGGLGGLFTPEFLPFGIQNLHPGAKRAYREAGLIK